MRADRLAGAGFRKPPPPVKGRILRTFFPNAGYALMKLQSPSLDPCSRKA